MPLPSGLCHELGTLSGFTIGITADRRRAEQAELLRGLGARVIEASVMRTLPLEADAQLREATDALIARPPDVLVATTGIGIRGWLAAAQAWGLEQPLLAALRSAEIVARGPKVCGALQQAGLRAHYEEPSEQLAPLVDFVIERTQPGGLVAIQQSGRDVPWALDAVTALGADVVSVRAYRWTGTDDVEPVRRLVASVLDGRVDAVTFTSAPAVEHFYAVAGDDAAALTQAFNHLAVAACVGPATAAACASFGVHDPCAPVQGRLGLMVRALSQRLAQNHRHLVVGEHHLVAQGRCLHARGLTIEMTMREHALFDVLTRHAGAVVSRETLLRQVWHSHEDGVLDKTMSRLRRRLAPTGVDIDTVARRGYVMRGTEVPCASPL
jgi:uroporphyrinogen-III synthase